MSDRDEGPVYYREIQKNAYLKRIPNDEGGRLKPLGAKKQALKPMWTLLCVHNGRTPYLEQYPSCEAPQTLAHAPVWRASLKTVRHVTASVSPNTNSEYDFLVDTDHGPVRLLAPDWDSMQDWVRTLRVRLSELKALPRAENVYMSPPAAPPPRLPARDPTSPLPPTPPVPPDRVPGIEIITPRQPVIPEVTEEPEQPPQPEPFVENVDISNWEDSVPSTSSEVEERRLETSSVAKICGQNICLDDSILKRSQVATDSDEEFFAEIDRVSESVDDDISEMFKQRLVVEAKSLQSLTDGEHSSSNVTVIQVSNKPPHTAIPVLGPETDVFDFEFKRNTPNEHEHSREPTNTNEFVNIVNTEVNVQNGTDNGYGTVFENDYGHISLTTTVNLTGKDSVAEVTANVSAVNDVTAVNSLTDVNRSTDIKVTDDGIYERLCMASTSKVESSSPLPVKKIKNLDKLRKSSLPNLDSESQYEYLFPNSLNKNLAPNNNKSKTNLTNALSNSNHNSREEINSNVKITNRRNIPKETSRTSETRHNNTSESRINNSNEPRHNNVSEIRHINASELRHNTSEPRYNNVSEIRYINASEPRQNNGSETRHNNASEVRHINASESSYIAGETRHNNASESRYIVSEPRHNNSEIRNQSIVQITNTVTVNNERDTRVLIERSNSQNAYDSAPNSRDQLIRRVKHNSPKRDGRNDKPESSHPKPIWKRGLTELSLLTKLRGLGAGKRQESPTRQESEQERNAPSQGKVIHRSRPEVRADNTRRRSSSLSNPPPAPCSLLAAAAGSLGAAQRRAAPLVAQLPAHYRLLLASYADCLWVASWGRAGIALSGRCGDRVVAVCGVTTNDLAKARTLMKNHTGRTMDILFHRVPLGKIYVLHKRDLEGLGINLDSECNITSIARNSSASRAGLPLSGRWAVTEVNNRPINIVKGGEEEMNRISLHGTEASVLIQPSALVKKLRVALKSNKFTKLYQ